MKKNIDMTWNVIYEDSSTPEMKVVNIFDHSGFLNDIKKQVKKSKTKAEFLEELRISLSYYFRWKCEYEIVISPWVGRTPAQKVDIYWQVMNNWHIFSEYVCHCLGVV